MKTPRLLASSLPLAGERLGERAVSRSVPALYPLSLTLSPRGERGLSVPEQESIA